MNNHFKFRFYIPIITCLLLSYNVMAQVDEPINSLIQKLIENDFGTKPVHLQDSIKVNRSLKHVSRCTGIRNDSAIYFAQQAIRQAEKSGLIEKTSNALQMMGQYFGRNDIIQLLNGSQIYLGNGVKEMMEVISPENNDLPMITKRESEILKLIANGLTNQKIANQLFISIFTVDSHRKNLLLKFNAKNTAALIRTVVSKGILDVD